MWSVPVTVVDAPSGRCWGLQTSPGRSVSPFLVIGDTRPFWVTEKPCRLAIEQGGLVESCRGFIEA